MRNAGSKVLIRLQEEGFMKGVQAVTNPERYLLISVMNISLEPIDVLYERRLKEIAAVFESCGLSRFSTGSDYNLYADLSDEYGRILNALYHYRLLHQKEGL